MFLADRDLFFNQALTPLAIVAGRSATAAKEIKDLIQDSVKKVEDGPVLVTQSGQTLGQNLARPLASSPPSLVEAA